MVLIVKKTYHHGRPIVKGRGMGSVLLSKGGPGAGSSYDSLEQYEKIAGMGLEKKLLNLITKPLVKVKNIHF